MVWRGVAVAGADFSGVENCSPGRTGEEATMRLRECGELEAVRTLSQPAMLDAGQFDYYTQQLEG